ncbi:cytochrome c biogenesis protein CcdA [Tenacibaculum sp. MAR_2009_124]|uniref:cytochrome c biogenesis protein CcdA n=1 Tax=Tenacibaculum sp. MAR_2009_124 TaxID=1250059 RepID=UPI002100A6D2|nr:cytochrome c biogenesis protein CcdA [Tenacibaculum sp. MAR_2009_124]
MNLTRPLIAGVLHSFEPDHMSAVSVLASENAINKKKVSFKTVFKASQWALGHSVTLLLFGGIALLFRTALSAFVHNISFWAEMSIGPIMIWLGIVAIKRNHKINEMMADHKKIEEHEHAGNNPIHLHGKMGEEIAMNPINKSFWIGMLHGLAGTGGALTSALIISATTMSEAILILVVESIGVILSMAVYSYVLIYAMSRFIERNMSIFKWMNGIVGIISIIVGIYMIYKTAFA